jgi:hypothetical protein
MTEWRIYSANGLRPLEALKFSPPEADPIAVSPQSTVLIMKLFQKS